MEKCPQMFVHILKNKRGNDEFLQNPKTCMMFLNFGPLS